MLWENRERKKEWVRVLQLHQGRDIRPEDSTCTMAQRVVRAWTVWGTMYGSKVYSGGGEEKTPKNILSIFISFLAWKSCEVSLPIKFYGPHIFHPYVWNLGWLERSKYLMLIFGKKEVYHRVETILFANLT